MCTSVQVLQLLATVWRLFHLAKLATLNWPWVWVQICLYVSVWLASCFGWFACHRAKTAGLGFCTTPQPSVQGEVVRGAGRVDGSLPGSLVTKSRFQGFSFGTAACSCSVSFFPLRLFSSFAHTLPRLCLRSCTSIINMPSVCAVWLHSGIIYRQNRISKQRGTDPTNGKAAFCCDGGIINFHACHWKYSYSRCNLHQDYMAQEKKNSHRAGP